MATAFGINLCCCSRTHISTSSFWACVSFHRGTAHHFWVPLFKCRHISAKSFRGETQAKAARILFEVGMKMQLKMYLFCSMKKKKASFCSIQARAKTLKSFHRDSVLKSPSCAESERALRRYKWRSQPPPRPAPVHPTAVTDAEQAPRWRSTISGAWRCILCLTVKWNAGENKRRERERRQMLIKRFNVHWSSAAPASLSGISCWILLPREALSASAAREFKQALNPVFYCIVRWRPRGHGCNITLCNVAKSNISKGKRMCEVEKIPDLK